VGAPALGLLALLQYIYHVTHTSPVPRRTRTQNDLNPFVCEREGDSRDAGLVATQSLLPGGSSDHYDARW
jgi:hypothetical protein